MYEMQSLGSNSWLKRHLYITLESIETIDTCRVSNLTSHPRNLIQLRADVDLHRHLLLGRVLLAADAEEGEDARLVAHGAVVEDALDANSS